MKKARERLRQVLSWVRFVMPLVIKKFPALAAWAAVIYVILDILAQLIG